MPPGPARAATIGDHLSLFEPSEVAELVVGPLLRFRSDSYLSDHRRVLSQEWVSALPSGVFRDDAYRLPGQGSRGADFHTASDAVASAGPGDVPPAFAEGLAIRYATEPAAHALAWLERVPDDVREISVRAFFQTAGANDPVGASSMLPQLPDDPLLRASATKAIADAWLKSGEAPDKLSDWLGGISAPAEAAAAAQSIAEARITTGFTAQDRARLLSRLSP